MKKILIIDESKLFRDYLVGKLVSQGFHVTLAVNGLDGISKMRTEIPDLVVMDYYLTRKSCLEVLADKKANPNLAKIPVILVSGKINKEELLQVSKFGLSKFFSKPLMIDVFLNHISDLLKTPVKLDSTPCIIEAHFNDDILFVEIARGLNTEKIELLSFKVRELLELYEVKNPRILIMMSNLEIGPNESGKLEALLNIFLRETNSPASFINILTTIEFVSKFTANQEEYKDISVFSTLGKAMDEILGMKADRIAHDTAAAKLLTASRPKSDKEESIQLRFEQEGLAGGREISVAVVDDDYVIQQMVKTTLTSAGWQCTGFSNGRAFTEDLEKIRGFDLIFLDLVMPEMDGFQVLQKMKEGDIQTPVIIFSALTQKETVAKALSYGIKSYLIKPLKPDKLFRKAIEVLKANF
jgi:DNA-binding response OmpR family regulator